MVIVINKESFSVSAYSTMVKACKDYKWSYSYLKNRKFSNKPFDYKGYYIYRLKTSDILSL